MEVSEMLETLVGDLTAYQFMSLLFIFVMMIALLFMSAAAVAEIISHIIKGFVYIFRKDKYKSRDITFTRACKHIASLRRQFKSARTDTEYIIFLNRLSAAFMAYVEIGLIPFDYFDKVFKVSSLYNKELEKEYALHARVREISRKKHVADDMAIVQESEEK